MGTGVANPFYRLTFNPGVPSDDRFENNDSNPIASNFDTPNQPVIQQRFVFNDRDFLRFTMVGTGKVANYVGSGKSH